MRPKLVANFLAGDKLTRAFEEEGQDPERLFLKANAAAHFCEFVLTKIGFEGSKLDKTACGLAMHLQPPLPREFYT